ASLGDYSKFRALSRLLRLQQYVLLADGRVMEAMANARAGLRLSRVVQADTLLSGLVGVAISASGIRSLGSHLEQLSAGDCELLYQVCLEWLREPSPLPRVLAGERRMVKATLAEMREKQLAALAQGAPGA